MKACVFSEYGLPDKLHYSERDKPTPKDDEVLIQVHASSVNDWDWQLLQGIPLVNRLFNGYRRPKKVTNLGCDVSGVIEAVGKNVTQFSPGDEVYGDLCECGFSAYAEYVCAPENAILHKPNNLSFEEAASLPQTSIIALQGLEFRSFDVAGKSVLINGASGGVGTLALQMAKAFQACKVTAVCSEAKKDLVTSLGADEVIDYKTQDFTQIGNRYDLILDVKGFHHFFHYRRVLANNGTYALQGGASSTIIEALILSWIVNLTSQQTMGIQFHKPNQGLQKISDLVESGKLKPIIDRVFSFDEIPEAFRYYGAGKARGKVVIRIK